MTKKVLVTGGCGFIGSELVSKLVKKGYDVIVVDNLSKSESKAKLDCEFLNLDLSKKENALMAFKNIDICINLAAKIGGIGYFHKHPATILSENNKIYSATFEAAVKNNLERMVYVSSSMVFESTNSFPSKETHLTKNPPPLTAYGFSKLCGEWYCRAFNEEFGLNYTICRPFNAYGANEYPSEEIGYAHVIPDLIKKIINKQYPLEILGNGNQTRCFTHVRDLADGVIMLMEHENAINQDFNIGTDKEIKIIDLAEIIWELCEQDKEFKVKFVKGFDYDVQRRVPDISKIRSQIGWEPKIDFKEGLKEVIDWIRTLK